MTLKDQFGQEFVKIIKPSELCPPVIKRHISSPPPRPTPTPTPTPTPPCEIPQELIERLNKCVGDECVAIKEKIESIKKACSKIQLQSQLLTQGESVKVEPTAESVEISPLDAEVQKILKDTHLKCYEFEEISGPKEYPEVKVTDQFGTETVKIIKPKKLCNPASKNLIKEVLGVSAVSRKPDFQTKLHYKCYEIQSTAQRDILAARSIRSAGNLQIPAAVFLTDQFIKSKTRILEPELLCTPVIKVHGKRGEIKQSIKGAPSSYDHLKCYRIKEEIGNLPTVRVTDQFGIEILQPKETKYLCNPAQKIVIPPHLPPVPPEPPPEPPKEPPTEPPKTIEIKPFPTPTKPLEPSEVKPLPTEPVKPSVEPTPTTIEPVPAPTIKPEAITPEP